MIIVDLFLRFSTIALLLLLSILALRDLWALRPARIAVILALSVSASLLNLMPEPFTPTGAAHVVLALMCAPLTALTWMFGLSVFSDGRPFPKFVWIISAGHIALTTASVIPGAMAGTLDDLSGLIALGLMTHLICILLLDQSDDLVANRRRGRICFLTAIASITIISTILRNIFPEDIAAFAPTFKLLAIFGVTSWAALWFTAAREEGFSFETPASPEKTKHNIDPRDAALHAALTALFSEEHIHTEPNLTVRSLAQRLNTPEHRLRALINQGMGYRNFSAFLNEHRIQNVKAALADPNKTRLPILTIAMDAGYNSLAPFNKAFRMLEGVTPSTYRRNLWSEAE